MTRVNNPDAEKLRWMKDAQSREISAQQLFGDFGFFFTIVGSWQAVDVGQMSEAFVDYYAKGMIDSWNGYRDMIVSFPMLANLKLGWAICSRAMTLPASTFPNVSDPNSLHVLTPFG